MAFSSLNSTLRPISNISGLSLTFNKAFVVVVSILMGSFEPRGSLTTLLLHERVALMITGLISFVDFENICHESRYSLKI